MFFLHLSLYHYMCLPQVNSLVSVLLQILSSFHCFFVFPIYISAECFQRSQLQVEVLPVDPIIFFFARKSFQQRKSDSKEQNLKRKININGQDRVIHNRGEYLLDLRGFPFFLSLESYCSFCTNVPKLIFGRVLKHTFVPKAKFKNSRQSFSPQTLLAEETKFLGSLWQGLSCLNFLNPS